MFSIEKVADELAALDDELTAWARQRAASFFLKPDGPVIPCLQVTSAWANGANYETAAVSEFLQVADSHLVAHAHAHGHVVVTQEIASISTKRSRPRTPASAWA